MPSFLHSIPLSHLPSLHYVFEIYLTLQSFAFYLTLVESNHGTVSLEVEMDNTSAQNAESRACDDITVCNMNYNISLIYSIQKELQEDERRTQ